LPEPTSKKLIRDIRSAEKHEAAARRLRENATDNGQTELGLANPTAAELIAAFKPPR
jgi:hypothetical protein